MTNGVSSRARLPRLESQAALPGHVTLSKLLNLSVPNFSHLKNANNNTKSKHLELL